MFSKIKPYITLLKLWVIILLIKKCLCQLDEDVSDAHRIDRSISFKLYGNVYSIAYYFADMYFGTSIPQRQSLVVDTGSSVTGFVCKDSKEILGNHLDKPFNFRLSSTTRKIRCQPGCVLCVTSNKKDFLSPVNDLCAYHVEYMENSMIEGAFFEDKMWISSLDPDKQITLRNTVIGMPFGCQLNETNKIKTQLASGILGLQFPPDFGIDTFLISYMKKVFSPSSQKELLGSLISRMKLHTVPESSVTQPMFSVCFASEGGILTIGKNNSDYHVHKTYKSNHNLKNLFNLKHISTQKPNIESSTSNQQTILDTSIPVNVDRRLLTSYSTLVSSSEWMNNPQYRFLKPISFYIPGFLEHYKKLYYIDFDPSLSISDKTINPKDKNVLQASSRHEFGYTEYIPKTSTSLIQWTPMVPIPQWLYDNLGYSIFLTKFSIVTDLILEKRVISLNLPEINVAKLSSFQQRFIEVNAMNPRNGIFMDIDTGATASYFPKFIYQEFMTKFVESLRAKLDLFFSLANNESFFNYEDTYLRRKLSNHKTVLKNDLLYEKLMKFNVEGVNLNQLNNQKSKTFTGNARMLQIFQTTSGDTNDFQGESSSTNNEMQELEKEGCWILDVEEEHLFDLFPTLELTFSNELKYEWKPQNYMQKLENELYCLSIMFIEDIPVINNKRRLNLGKQNILHKTMVPYLPVSVLGANFFLNHDVIFHLGQWKLGIAKAECPKFLLKNRPKY